VELSDANGVRIRVNTHEILLHACSQRNTDLGVGAARGFPCDSLFPLYNWMARAHPDMGVK
jgi:hypothetical protein